MKTDNRFWPVTLLIGLAVGVALVATALTTEIFWLEVLAWTLILLKTVATLVMLGVALAAAATVKR